MIGIDEVGRGAWAGPLLVVAARLKGTLPHGVADSKVLTPKKRQALIPELLISCEFGEGWVTAREVDALGLTKAMKTATARALANLAARRNEEIIIDGPINYASGDFEKVNCIIDADASYPIVSAASIYAKERRDEYMRSLDKNYPTFGFSSHVGYGTKKHQLALEQFGTTIEHRRTYVPVLKYAGDRNYPL
jgi:ribonuclease HII